MIEGTIIGFGVSGGELCCLLGERQDTAGGLRKPVTKGWGSEYGGSYGII